MIRPSPPLVFGAEAEAEAAVVEKASLQEKGGGYSRRQSQTDGGGSRSKQQKRGGGRSEGGGGGFAISPITRSVTEQKELSCLTIALPSSPIGGRVVSCNC